MGFGIEGMRIGNAVPFGICADEKFISLTISFNAQFYTMRTQPSSAESFKILVRTEAKPPEFGLTRCH
jgi:hypothetical protein